MLEGFSTFLVVDKHSKSALGIKVYVQCLTFKQMRYVCSLLERTREANFFKNGNLEILLCVWEGKKNKKEKRASS